MGQRVMLDRANWSKIQYGSGAPGSTTPGNIYVDSLTGMMYIRKTPSGTVWIRPEGLVDTNESYDAFGTSPAIVTINNAEGQGSLRFRPTTSYDFIIDVSNSGNPYANGHTFNDVRGFRINNGTDFLNIGRTTTNQLSIRGYVQDINLYSVDSILFEYDQAAGGTSTFKINRNTSTVLQADASGRVQVGNGAPGHATNVGDLFVQDILEVDGMTYNDGGISVATSLTADCDITFTGSQAIVSTSDGNITINPNGTGSFLIGSTPYSIPVSPGTENQILALDGSNNLEWRVSCEAGDVTTTSSNAYAVLATDGVVLSTGSLTAETTVTIPSALIAVSGYRIIIKDAGFNASTYNLTIATEGAETIDSNSSFIINGDGDSLTLVSDGSNLFII